MIVRHPRPGHRHSTPTEPASVPGRTALRVVLALRPASRCHVLLRDRLHHLHAGATASASSPRDSASEAAFFSDNFVYGYGPTFLASGTWHVVWNLGAGPLTRRRTSALPSLTIKRMSNILARYSTESHYVSPKNYCWLGDSKDYDHYMVNQMSWDDENAPGYFWVYAKSIVAHIPRRSGVFTFDSPASLPAVPFDSGYDE